MAAAGDVLFESFVAVVDLADKTLRPIGGLRRHITHVKFCASQRAKDASFVEWQFVFIFLGRFDAKLGGVVLDDVDDKFVEVVLFIDDLFEIDHANNIEG